MFFHIFLPGAKSVISQTFLTLYLLINCPPFAAGGNSKKRDLFEVLESVPMTPTGTTTFRQLDEPPDLNRGAAGVETIDMDGQDKDKQDDRLDEEMSKLLIVINSSYYC